MVGGELADCVSDLMGIDHRGLDAELADVKRLLLIGEIASARARFGSFREALEHHIEAEEQVLFPELERLAKAEGGGPTDVMRAEHVELKKFMLEIDRVLAAGTKDGLTTPLAGLTARIYAHNGKEERILYPMTDRLGREAGVLGDLVARLRAF